MTMDWNDITSKSLPSVGTPRSGAQGAISGSNLTPQHHWQRNLASLQVASQSLLDSSSTAASSSSALPSNNAGGGGMGSRFRTLSSPSANATFTTNTPHNRQQQQQQQSQQQQQQIKSNVQDAVAQYQENLIAKIRAQPDEAIHAETSRVITDFLQASWERKHHQWLDELGVGGPRSNNPTGSLTDSTNTRGGASSLLLPHGYSGSSVAARTIGKHRYGATASSSSASSSSLWPTMSSSHASGVASPSTRLDPHMIQAHAAVVQQMPRLEPHETARAFGKLTPAAPSPADSGYNTAWKWMDHLLQAQEERRQYQQGMMNANSAYGTADMDPVDQAMATLVHLGVQFRNCVDQTIHQAVMSGQSDLVQETYLHPIAKHCEAYAKLLLGPNTNNASSTPWAILYYCLRCGNGSEAALDVWQTCSKSAAQLSDTVTDAITRLLVAMKPWDTAKELPQAGNADRRIVGDYLESLEEANQEPQSSPMHTYQIGFLALLSGVGEMPVANVHGFCTIEDYLFVSISRALLSRDAEEELKELGKSIQGYGPSYFGDNDSGGWSYALPLLMTQQYSKALTHLVEVGSSLGLLQATHLGLLLSLVSEELHDLGNPNPSHSEDDLPAALLAAYATRLLNEPTAGTLGALEYLVQIPNREKMRKEVASLLARSSDYRNLAGYVDEQGSRHGGQALDAKFSPEEVSIILADAAEQLLRDNHSDKEKIGSACMCYFLAGRYESVLRVLNEMLSPPNEANIDRQFWMEQTQQFHQMYLDKRTRVLENLELEGNLNVIQNSRYLMDLNRFFQHSQAAQYSEAWNIAQSTQLLPGNRDDMAAKQDQYRSLDDTVKRSFSAFLVGVMNTLFRLHSQIKTTGSRDAVTAQRLQELRDMARVLVAFAGMLGVASDSLSQMEASIY